MDTWKKIKPKVLEGVLQEAQFEWWFAGGWALDLWLGRETRAHGDLDFTIFRSHFSALYFLLKNDFEFYIATKGSLNKIKSVSDLERSDWNVWIKEKGAHEWSFQCLISDEIDQQWTYRRNQKIKRDKKLFGLMAKSSERIIAPEIQLLFKSKLQNNKDQVDFDNVVPLLSVSQKQWLRNSLKATYDYDHPWLNTL